ncbi:MAG: hypothetical protein QNK20_14015 [Aureibaculum sp.]|nr:hypothetical protein [Aureibaculum sp.]
MRFFISLSLILLIAVGCSLEGATGQEQQELDLKVLSNLGDDINVLIESSVCTDETECAFIAFGTKPCGGPWGYLVYSNSIDTDELIEKVERFNQLQNTYNLRYNIISDCSVVSPPDTLICEDNKCKAVYN